VKNSKGEREERCEKMMMRVRKKEEEKRKEIGYSVYLTNQLEHLPTAMRRAILTKPVIILHINNGIVVAFVRHAV